jgi:ketosteroid isomerase-like protein
LLTVFTSLPNKASGMKFRTSYIQMKLKVLSLLIRRGLQSAKGREALKKKGENFNEAVEEMHGGYCGKPIVAGNHFSVAMGMDATMKGMGRVKMDEIAVYEVKDGKIVKEQFFF